MLQKLYDIFVKVISGFGELVGLTFEESVALLFVIIIPVIFIAILITNYNIRKDRDKYRLLYEKFVRNDINNVI